MIMAVLVVMAGAVGFIVLGLQVPDSVSGDWPAQNLPESVH